MDLESDLADAPNMRTTVTTAMMPMSGAESAMETGKYSMNAPRTLCQK